MDIFSKLLENYGQPFAVSYNSQSLRLPRIKVGNRNPSRPNCTELTHVFVTDAVRISTIFIREYMFKLRTKHFNFNCNLAWHTSYTSYNVVIIIYRKLFLQIKYCPQNSKLKSKLRNFNFLSRVKFVLFTTPETKKYQKDFDTIFFFKYLTTCDKFNLSIILNLQ